MRFNYYLVIGSQRSSCSKTFGAQGQVVQIPFRVLNHVSGKTVNKQDMYICINGHNRGWKSTNL